VNCGFVCAPASKALVLMVLLVEVAGAIHYKIMVSAVDIDKITLVHTCFFLTATLFPLVVIICSSDVPAISCPFNGAAAVLDFFAF